MSQDQEQRTIHIEQTADKVRSLMERGKSDSEVMSELNICSETLGFYQLVIINQDALGIKGVV